MVNVNDEHADSCRKCGQVVRRSDMMPARKVLGRQNARGWFCQFCGLRQMDLDKWLKANRVDGVAKPRWTR